MTTCKEYAWYAAVALAMLLFGLAELFGAGIIIFLPLLLALVFVGFWAFDYK